MLESHLKQVNRSILLIHCPDQTGIIAIISDFIYRNNGNIIYLDQHVDTENKVFFMRVEWDLEGFIIPKEKLHDYFQTLIADRFQMQFRLYFTHQIPRMAIFVSKMSHCLDDLLARTHSGEWNIEIPLIISNHPDLKPVADRFNIDFYHLPITPENKELQELKQIELLETYSINFIVLARYMQIVSENIISKYQHKIINIHHSFLPAFPGAKPYHSAHKRGVKIIGVTSHYVTEELDAGPIIEQDVARVTHKETVNDLIRKGRDLEKIVLSRAVWYHINRRILAYDNRTVVFE
jgi:formyltetrahydrofolate deformylase